MEQAPRGAGAMDTLGGLSRRASHSISSLQEVNLATFFFDGTKDLTVTKSDVVVVTGGAASYAGASFGVFGAGATATFGAFKVTVSDATDVKTLNTVLSVPGGSINIDPAAPLAAGNNTLASSLTVAGPHVVTGAAASQVSVILGGSSLNDSGDGADLITIGGKGTFTVYGNGGADKINTGAVFDSSTVATVYGGAGDDEVTLGTAGVKAAITVYGNGDLDKISVNNAGTTTIFGGSSLNDSADKADQITFEGGGTFTVYGNGGDDVISLGATKLDSTAVATVYGGAGADQINLDTGGAKATITVYGGSDAGVDQLTVANKGTTTIYGGSGVNDSADSTDNITFSGGGTFTIYGNGGDDLILGGLVDAKTVSTVYGGAGKDTVNVFGADSGNTTVYGNAGEDNLTVNGNGKSTVTVYGGSGFSDATDAKDVIVLNGVGAFTAYGNGGDDQIIVNVANTAGDTTSVFGGAGKDSINLNSVTAAGGTVFTLSGGSEADTFNITKGTGAQVTISDYTTADKMVISAVGAAGTAGAVSSSATTLQGALDAAATGADKSVGIVAFEGNSYVVVRDGVAGFGAGDMAIKLTGVTDVLALANTITFS